MENKKHHRPPMSAVGGGIVWLALVGLFAYGEIPRTLIELIFLLAPLVIVPLGLRVAAAPRAAAWEGSLARWLNLLQPIGAALAVLSFWPSPGRLSAILASGWLAVCFIIALCGFIRILKEGFESPSRMCFPIGLLYISVGGLWLVASRLGATPMGFTEPIVLLTAVHFHYSGFAAPIVLGATGEAMGGITGFRRTILDGVSWGVMVAPGVLALGFVISPFLKVLAAFILAASLIGLSILTFELIPAIDSRRAKAVLTISALSIPAGMMLAVVYAVGDFMKLNLISIAPMAKFHGLTNSLGFALCGLLGWTMVPRKATMPAQAANAWRAAAVQGGQS